jgi:acetyl esterase/lipase
MRVFQIQLTEDQTVSLTCYIQDVSNEMKNVHKRPAMLVLPGGGYHFCSDREAEPIALAYLAEGYNAFVLRYSLQEKSKFPRPLNDAELALTHIRDNAKDYGVIVDKIAVIGFSAGGHLAASLGTNGAVRPNAMILGYPALIRSKKYDWDYPTPVVDEKTPEAFVFHTYFDDLVHVENAMYITNQMIKNNIPVEFHLFKSGVHGLSLGNHLVSGGSEKMVEVLYQEWFKLSVSWLNDLFEVF